MTVIDLRRGAISLSNCTHFAHGGFFGPETSDVTAGTGQTLHEALGHRIGNGNKHDGDGAGCLSRGDQRRRRIDHEDVGSPVEQLLGERLRPARISGGPTIFDFDVATG